MSPARTTAATGALAAGVVAVDQLTKALVRDGLVLGERRDLVAGIDLVNVRNSGIAFGFLSDGGALLVVGTVLLVMLARGATVEGRLGAPGADHELVRTTSCCVARVIAT